MIDQNGEPTGTPDSSGVHGAVDAALLLRLEHAVAEILAGPPHGEVVFSDLLAAIGSALKWPVGSVWRPRTSPDSSPTRSLHCVATWSTSNAPGEAFTQASRGLVLAPGVGLPGRVWRTGKPEWISDVSQDENFPRAAAAARAGLVAAFCFPIVGRDGLEGLMEFFAPRRLEPAPELLRTVTSLGLRIGDTLHRQRVDDAVRLSEARLRAVLAAALDAVVIADADGLVLEFNPAATAIFGYRREDAIGRELAELIVPPDLRAKHRAGLARYLRTGKPRALDRRIEINGMHSDGSVFPVELTITRIGVSGRPVFAGYLRDLSDRQRAEDELKASRRRVVEAVVEERARLERDLHDGAQQRLVSLGTALARARTVLPAEPDRAGAILDDAIATLEDAAVELRNLARGIHPTSLTRYGLAAALSDMARRSPVELRLGALPTTRFPASVEATAYFVVSEALTNVARHAGAGSARVGLSVTGTDVGTRLLEITISDDGPGGARPDRGTGLRGLADRVALLDGWFELASPPGGGTTLRARIPLS